MQKGDVEEHMVCASIFDEFGLGNADIFRGLSWEVG